MYPGGVAIGGSTNRTLRTSLICQAREGESPDDLGHPTGLATQRRTETCPQLPRMTDQPNG